MGVKGTYDISREVAIQVILTKVHECTNEQLSDMLRCFKESEFRNYSVEDVLGEEPEYGPPQISHINRF